LRLTLKAELIAMGDLAVPTLAQSARGGNADCVSMLHSIGTPQAAKALVPFLSDSSYQYIRMNAAVALGDLLRNKNVEYALGSYPLGDSAKKSDRLRWVWKPLGDQGEASLPLIAGRIGLLLAKLSEVTTRSYAREQASRIDRRIIIPLLVSINSQHLIDLNFNRIEISSWFDEMDVSKLTLAGLKKVDPQLSANVSHLRETLPLVAGPILTGLRREAQPSLMWLLRRLDLLPRLDMVARLVSNPKPTVDDWLNVLRPRVYDFGTGIHFSMICMLLSSLLAMGTLFAARHYYFTDWSLDPAESYVLLFVGGVSLCLLIAQSIGGIEIWGHRPRDLAVYFGAIYLNPVEAISTIRLSEGVFKRIGIFPTALVAVLFPPTLAYACTRFMLFFITVPEVVVVWALFLSVIFWLRREGLRRHRLAHNPLHGVLDVPETMADVQDLMAKRSASRRRDDDLGP
jgi:hypothetical protein